MNQQPTTDAEPQGADPAATDVAGADTRFAGDSIADSRPAAQPSPTQLELMNAAAAGTLVERMGIELLEFGPDRCVGRMPVAGNTQPYGLLHGGASGVLAETLGSYAASAHAQPDGIAVGIELSCTHHRSARQGFVTGVATALHLGRTIASYEIVVSDESERRICTARLTCAIRPNVPA